MIVAEMLVEEIFVETVTTQATTIIVEVGISDCNDGIDRGEREIAEVVQTEAARSVTRMRCTGRDQVQSQLCGCLMCECEDVIVCIHAHLCAYVQI